MPNKSITRPFLFIFSISIIIFILLSFTIQETRGAAPLQITYINVGQGDCILLRDPNGFTILVDGGKPAAGPTIVSYLKSKGITSLDVILATHADSDHIGGLITVLRDDSIAVHRVLYNGYAGSTATWSNFLAAVTNKGLTLEAAQFPETLHLGTLTVWIMNPASGLGSPETNDASVVMKVIYGTKAFLFTGDISSTIEATVIARNTPLASDVLKVAHHGSAYSSSPNFLASVEPEEAVISVGVNSYGHPSEGTIARLQASGARVWRTDLNGNVIVNSDGQIYTISDIPIYSVYLPFVIKVKQ
jgi:competence protein ComEC